MLILAQIFFFEKVSLSNYFLPRHPMLHHHSRRKKNEERRKKKKMEERRKKEMEERRKKVKEGITVIISGKLI